MGALVASHWLVFGLQALTLLAGELWYEYMPVCRTSTSSTDSIQQVAIKTMKKTFDSFSCCLELREIIFLRTLPTHQHLVPALDIFLDPYTKKLHIAMEYMDGNLYQLMKARDHKVFDGSSVKSILYQILSGLNHIHNNSFFHRDIKPENILVSVSAREELGNAFKRYSQLVTPPSTPPSYSIKIADFGLARETDSKSPYTTYVSTRWYRAPEVLLRAGEYSAPVDIWAIGAMAVEIATLKPLFPGGNEVDQVWRVCEIMGSPGNWVNKTGQRVGGGDWKDGVKLAQKLGFSFPKMAPHTLDTILQAPTWPPALSQFVTWCLLWDPKNRPTCQQAMAHEYFTDAYDPLRPKSSGSRLLGRKQSATVDPIQAEAGTTLSSKTSSWFRRSLVARESAPTVPRVPERRATDQPLSPRRSPIRTEVAQAAHMPQAQPQKPRPQATKRNTWTNGASTTAAPMPILPSIRPVSPLSNAVTAQAHAGAETGDQRTPKKLGRQLSQASHSNHYADAHRQDAERALNGNSGLASPTTSQRESFFSHLRKRARRFSGRPGVPMSPKEDDVEANPGCAPWAHNNGRNSITDIMNMNYGTSNTNFSDLDQALQNVRNTMEAADNIRTPGPSAPAKAAPQRVSSNPMLKRHHSVNQGQVPGQAAPGMSGGLLPSRSVRRAAQKQMMATNQYETPDEQEELLDEALNSASTAAMQLDRQQHREPMYQGVPGASHNPRPHLRHAQNDVAHPAPYPTPSPSAKRNSVVFGNGDPSIVSKPIEIQQNKHLQNSTAFPFPTPPDDNEWAAAAAASMGLGDQWRR